MFGLSTKHELYTFSVGSTVYNFTSGKKKITHNSVVYEPRVIDRDDIESTYEMEKNTVGIRFPMLDAFAQGLLRSLLEKVVIVTIYEYVNGTKTYIWRGRLTGISPDTAEIELNFESEFTQLNAQGNRILYQRTCPFALYSSSCRANKDNFRFKTTISALSGITVTVRESFSSDGLFNLGMLQHIDGELVGIEKQVGSVLTLLNRFDFTITSNDVVLAYETALSEYDAAVAYLATLTTSDPEYANAEQDVADKLVVLNAADAEMNWIYMYYGCDKTKPSCEDRFNNYNNFGGFAYLPMVNPTSKSVV